MLQNLIQGPLNINEENLRVKDVLVNGVWDFSCISFDVSPQLVHSIKAIPVRSASFNIDSIIWASSSCGEFDPRNAYNLVATISVPPIQFDGAWIWKLDIIPKIKFFLWKCWLQCLPTSSNLVHSGPLILNVWRVKTEKNPLFMSLETASLLGISGLLVVSLALSWISMILILRLGYISSVISILRTTVVHMLGRPISFVVFGLFGFKGITCSSSILAPIWIWGSPQQGSGIQASHLPQNSPQAIQY